MAWTQDERTNFVSRLCAYWGRWEPEEAWAFMEDLQKYPCAQAIAAITSVWKSQDRRWKPTVKTVLDEIPAELRRPEDKPTPVHGPVFTKSEIAKDETFWERLYDQAESLDKLEALKALRSRMLRGRPLLEASGL